MRFLCFLAPLILSLTTLCAEHVVWSGEVSSNGNPTALVKLTPKKKYQIKASGEINLGKWWQLGKPLADDACYEYNELVEPRHVNTLKNSLQISLCDGTYHADHIYISKPFIADQGGIHFWVQDIDYNDNKGSLKVELIELPE